MISVEKRKQKPQVLQKADISKKLHTIINKNSNSPGSEINNFYNHIEVKTDLTDLYKSKCAYCEGKIPEGYAERIDHFRPKNKIKGVKNHKGYFWLGYEWTNLLPTCEKCNGKKSNKFPLENKNNRISDDLEKEGFLKNGKFIFENFNIENLNKQEEPLLLHPEIDKVEEHLFFLPNGEIKGLTPKGKKSIEVYGLNRNTLILERYKIILKITTKIIEIFAEYPESIYDMLKNLYKEQFAEKEYSRFRYFIFQFHEIFIIEKLNALELETYAKYLELFFKENKHNLTPNTK